MTGMQAMNSRDRVLAALAGQPVDRPPVCNPTNVSTVELMDLVDARFPDANREPELNARLAATSYTELGFDSIMPYFTGVLESSALGAEIQWEGKDNWATVRMNEPIWRTDSDVVLPADFMEHSDTAGLVRTIEILKREYPDAAVLGKTFGPWTLGYFLFGVQEFLTMSIDDPEMTVRCLEPLKEISFVFGEAQIAAGADVIVFPDHVTGDLVSGEYYEKFLLEIHQEAVETLPVPLIMHICGYTLDRLDTVARSGMAAFHFDSKNDPQKARDIAGDRIGLVGNINNPVTLYSKEPADVRAEVFACLDAGVDMIAPECAIPLATKLENLIEIPRAVKEWTASH